MTSPTTRRSTSTTSAPSTGVRFARAPRRQPTAWEGEPARGSAVCSTSADRSSYRVRRAIVSLAIAATIAGSGSATSAEAAGPAPYSAHAMLYTCCTPHALKDRLFSEAKAMRSSYIRLAVEVGPIFEAGSHWRQQPDWAGLDQVISLSRSYHLPVVGVLYATPGQLSSCPHAADPGKCAPTDYGRYGGLAGAIAAHARGVIHHWEVVNEPDGNWAFRGTPGQYAWMLRRAYDGIKSVAPEDRVAIGGVMSPGSRDWLTHVFDTPGADARHRFDIANVHLRGTVDSLSWGMQQFRGFFARYGFHGPLWVTEHGYPGETRYQRDPRYRGGEPAQARYLRQALPTLVRAGADQVFITLRDATAAEFGDSEFASEGVLHVGGAAPYPSRRKPAFGLTRWLAGLWPNVPATRRELDGWRVALGVDLQRARRLKRRVARERRLVRRYLARSHHARSRAARRWNTRRARDHKRRLRRFRARGARYSAAARHLRSMIAAYREGP